MLLGDISRRFTLRIVRRVRPKNAMGMSAFRLPAHVLVRPKAAVGDVGFGECVGSQARWFLSIHGPIYNTLNLQPCLISRPRLRTLRVKAKQRLGGDDPGCLNRAGERRFRLGRLNLSAPPAPSKSRHGSVKRAMRRRHVPLVSPAISLGRQSRHDQLNMLRVILVPAGIGLNALMPTISFSRAGDSPSPGRKATKSRAVAI